ncbi:ATP-binding cassette domain-containing protein [Sphaerotilus mobilis]|uniref:Peptide/nickel transport system ATP-binding protein/oligopeptide transport system ATP-binding protein n=1 Tax=Sphaerotilus mobilis TaxID=47994 RepID=A0A4Q7LFT9_9BURK|nr:ATP-binding cassette domain-containing protein [Sphaerotilus mobilis]RZS53395.1 peptide/nickel transport system ATP-binding protein/oligopeptide transport system ATP-binding protein [Sphaerotilus mobilis]
MNPPLLAVRELVKVYPTVRSTWWGGPAQGVRALDGVSLELSAGRTLGVVGESGCGKSTLARCILNLIEPSSGEVRIDGRPVDRRRRTDRLAWARAVQIIFQDPQTSLDPLMTVADIVGEGLVLHGLVRGRAERDAQVVELLAQVGLGTEHLRRHPHAFSGGQRQRIAIARALAVRPRLLVCDEAVSALDVSVQAQVLNLLVDLQRRQGLGMVFISHDLAAVAQVSDHVAVMQAGRVVECRTTADLLEQPGHPCTRALLAALPCMPGETGQRALATAPNCPSE